MKSDCNSCAIKSKAASKLSDEQIERLSYNCAHVKFRKKDPLIKQGNFSTNVAYLRSGLAKIHVRGPYHEQIVRIIKSPSYLGLPTTFGDKINQYSVTAIEDAEVCFIDMQAFWHLLRENPDFSNEIMIDLCKNELEDFYRCTNRTQKQIRGKIADVLLDFSDRIYKSDVFRLPINQEDIGNLVDSTRETVSKVLNELHEDGIIKMNCKEVEIRNKKSLLRISATG